MWGIREGRVYRGGAGAGLLRPTRRKVNSQRRKESARVGGRGGEREERWGGGCTYLSFASHFSIAHAFLSRQSTAA